MTAPTIAVITQTLGRPSFKQTAKSIVGQLAENDRWIVIGDGNQQTVRRVIRTLGCTQVVDLCDDSNGAKYGNRQRNAAIREAGTDYLVFLNDDDVLLPGALDAVRREGATRQPLMFKMDYLGRRTLWMEKAIRIGNVVGSMFVVPNVPERLSEWPEDSDFAGSDFAWIAGTLEKWPEGLLRWCDDVIIRCERVESAPVERQMILTSYLTSTPDPQRYSLATPNDPTRLLLLDGSRRLGVPVTVFHDQLSPKFCREHETERIRFERVEPCDYWSCNDYRFLVFLLWMIRESYAGRQKEAVFISDLFDVRINRNPLSVIGDNELVAGVHNDWMIDHTTRNGKIECQWLKHWFGRVPPECAGRPILMAGSWGGRWKTVRNVLGSLVGTIADLNPGMGNCNLPAFQATIYRHFGETIKPLGFPFVSQFRQYEIHADVAFVHK